MTIKRRLLLSSIIMVVCILLVGLLVIIGGKFFLKFKEIENSADLGYFGALVERMSNMADQALKTGNEERFVRAVKGLNTYNSRNGFNLEVFKDGRRIAGEASHVSPEVRQLVEAAQSGQMIQVGRDAAYSLDTGPYRLILTNTNLVLKDGGDLLHNATVLLTIGLTLILSTVFLSYFFLRCFVFKRIESALDTLVAGANEIRDGNLNCRLVYQVNDEFKEACDAFNEMAERLSNSVSQKQADEESRRQLIAGISHDLRTPLTSIRAYAEGLIGGVAVTDAMRNKYLNTIKMKAEDLEKILHQLFIFSKLDLQEFPLDMADFNLTEELKHIVESVDDEYKQKGLTLVFEAMPDVMPIKADKVQLRSALYNIFDNSLKYKAKNQGTLKITCLLSEGKAMIKLVDDGPGVTDQALGSLFDVFYRADSARTGVGLGSGLGLAITARIMKQLGGTIKVENAPGGGLAIIITFPLAGETDNEAANIDH